MGLERLKPLKGRVGRTRQPGLHLLILVELTRTYLSGRQALFRLVFLILCLYGGHLLL